MMPTNRLQLIEHEPGVHAGLTEPYLAACIDRLERLLRARALIWQAAVAQHKPDHLWGVPQISHDEVNIALALPILGTVERDMPRAAESEIKAAVAMSERLASLRAAASGSRLRRLEAAFVLRPAERDLLLLAALPEFDARYRRLLGYLLDDATQAWPSAEFASACLAPLHGSIRALLAPGGTLVATGLIETTPLGGGPRAQRGLKACFEAVDWLLDGDGIDGETIADARLVHPAGKPPAWIAASVLAAGRCCREQSALLMVAHGAGAADPHPFEAMAHAAGRPLLALSVVSAPAEEARIRAASRSASLHGALLQLRIELPAEPASADPGLRIGPLLARHTGPLVLASKREMSPAWLAALEQRPRLDLAMPMPGFAARAAFWAERLERCQLDPTVRPRELADEFADRFCIGHAAIETAIAQAELAARLRAPRAPRLTRQDLAAACRQRLAPNGTTLARHITPNQVELEFPDLVVPAATRRHIDDFVSRLGQRRRVLAESGLAARLPLGTATVALFTGAPGTGKTIAAMLIAKRLGLDLFKADLGKLVSKYIGETEQRLDRLFDVAEETDAVLFFDEADALFGRRGEVKEARDRWANLETNYLVQRIEEFEGIVILATNLRQNLDESFLRRIDVAIDFPLPDAALRLRLWRGLVPRNVEAPSEAELARLAGALPLAGGHIKSIMVDAVHRAYAAHDEKPGPVELTLRHLIEAAARTYEKLGRTAGPGEFAPEWLAWLREAAVGAER
jgi:hypothetical protein